MVFIDMVIFENVWADLFSGGGFRHIGLLRAVTKILKNCDS